MQAGTLDRRITIQQSTDTQDAAGQPIAAWSTFAAVWAGHKDMRGRERFASEQDLAVRTVTFRMYWLDGVHERMRVIDEDGTVYDIQGIAGDKRQNWLELSCEANNPAATA